LQKRPAFLQILQISDGFLQVFATGWRRLIECLKLQVTFRQRATNYRALLRKMTCEDKVWRRLVGCLKLQVIFRKRATNSRALLRKMTCEDMASYDSTPPCTLYVDIHVCMYICMMYIFVYIFKYLFMCVDRDVYISLQVHIYAHVLT